MKTDEDDRDEFPLTSAEDSTSDPEDPIAFMTYDATAKKARYYALLRGTPDVNTNPTEVELTQTEYRDLLATMQVTARNRLVRLLDELDFADVARAVRAIAYADEE